MSMRLFPGRVSLRRRPGAQARQALVLGLCCLTGGQAWALNEVALNCSFGNGKGLPWRVVNELTSGTAKGTVLFARPVSLFLNYKPQASQEAHELVIGGNWSGVGFPGPYGTVASDVKGIGYRISVDAQDGVKRVIPVDNQPHALDKRVTSFSGSTTSDYLQELVLTVDPGELPAGDLKVTSVSGSATLNLWAVDRLKGEASIGSVLAVPADNYPTGVCRKPYSLIGPASIGIGGGAPPPPRPPPRIASSSSWKYCSTRSRVRAAGRPAGLAEVEISGPVRWHSSCTRGWSVTRTATLSWTPVTHSGRRSWCGTSQVFGPGQVPARRSSQTSGRSSRRKSSWWIFAATTIRPFSTGRAFSASRRYTASSFHGSQPSPHTASVG